LFSATVTAFTIESYKWLAEDPADATVRLMAQLTQQLGAGATDISAVDYPRFTITAEAVRINIFWFLSLIIALSAALVGILCKQWIREYQRDIAISNQEAFELRQLRKQSWEAWRVPDIISSTSPLLQLALLLFFAGVVDLLWSRVRATVVAAVITVTAGLSVSFIIVTIMLPFSYDLFRVVLRDSKFVEWNNLFPCAYRSPLSRVLLSFSRSMTYRHWNSHQSSPLPDDKFKLVSDWSSVDLHLLRYSRSFPYYPNISYLHRGMKWAVNTLGDNVVMMKHIIRCMESSPSAGNLDTVVHYALRSPFDPTASSTWLRNVSRDHAYTRFLDERGYVRDLPHFYIEAQLRCIETQPHPFGADASQAGFMVPLASLVIREIHLARLPLGQFCQYCMIFEIIGQSILGLYLHFISTSRHVMSYPELLDNILLYWIQPLALSWVHDDDNIRTEGTLWALELEGTANPSQRPALLAGLSRIIYGTGQDWEVGLSEETRLKVISTKSFRDLFRWAGLPPPDERYLTEHMNEHDIMRDHALHFAHLPLDYFSPEQTSIVLSSLCPCDARGQNLTSPMVLKESLGGELEEPLVWYDASFTSFGTYDEYIHNNTIQRNTPVHVSGPPSAVPLLDGLTTFLSWIHLPMG
jgi:hypothetical protein